MWEGNYVTFNNMPVLAPFMLNATFLNNNQPITLVLLHGIFGKHDQLKFFFDLPANILAVDLPGHGKSSLCPEETILECTKKRLTQTLNHYGVKSHMLFGYSLGGFIVQELLASGWECDKAIIMAASPMLPTLDVIEKHNVLPKVKHALSGHEMLVGRIVDAFRTLRGDQFTVRGELDVNEGFAYLLALHNKNYSSALELVTTSCFVLCGKNDRLVPLAQARKLSGILKTVVYKEFNEDHFSLLRSKEVHKAIADFITN